MTNVSNILGGGGGISTDINLLMNHARQEALRHRLVRHQEISCGRLVRRISELMQGYSQYRPLRPFGVCLLFAGYDKDEGFQLFTVEPPGSSFPWKATSFGEHKQTCLNHLERYCSREMDCEEAAHIIIQILQSVYDSKHFQLERKDIEVVVMSQSSSEGVQINFMTQEEITELTNKDPEDPDE